MAPDSLMLSQRLFSDPKVKKRMRKKWTNFELLSLWELAFGKHNRSKNCFLPFCYSPSRNPLHCILSKSQKLITWHCLSRSRVNSWISLFFALAAANQYKAILLSQNLQTHWCSGMVDRWWMLSNTAGKNTKLFSSTKMLPTSKCLWICSRSFRSKLIFSFNNILLKENYILNNYKLTTVILFTLEKCILFLFWVP